ncbi:MAG: lipoate--protein ligase family protein [Methanomassiliicoccales archaeon]|nr:lipoate--protein ligase family protein [Methanomassiliicoccales archaeon]
MKWRVVDFEYWNAWMNMALDEAIGEAVGSGRSPSTIRFYGWNPSAVSIGCFQSIKDEVDLEACRRMGVDIVRRRTGGGAVYHDREGEITYSVIAPEEMVQKDINKAYETICGWIVDALDLMEITANIIPINDILVEGRKISGSAQTRRGGVFLQHGTLLYNISPGKMFSVLKVGCTKISDKNIASFEDRVTSILRHAKISKDKVLQELRRSFTKGKEWEAGVYTEEERRRARQLVVERYSKDEWNFSR